RVVGHVADREILTVNAALGSRELDEAGGWVERPEVPPPEECPRRPPRLPGVESIQNRIDLRLANARSWEELEGNPMPGGRSQLWARMPDLLDLSSGASLAILGDYVPFGIGQALGRNGGGNSLDNTLRVYRLVPTEWVLLDIRIHAVANGFGHGAVHPWAEDGTLLAARVGAARPPHPRRRQRLRPRRRPPVGGGRHPARHRQPVDDRAARAPGHDARLATGRPRRQRRGRRVAGRPRPRAGRPDVTR